MSSIVVKSRAGLADLLKEGVLTQKMSAEEGLAILVAYLVREGTITEISLPTPTE